MKSPKLAVLLLAFGVVFSAVVHAQDQNAPSGETRRGKGGQGQGGRGQMMSPEERVAQLDKALSLTEEQKTKINDIYAKAGEQMREAFRGGGGDREAARSKMMESMRKTREDVRALLTDEQNKKFDDLPQRGGGEKGSRGQGKRGGNNN